MTLHTVYTIFEGGYGLKNGKNVINRFFKYLCVKYFLNKAIN